MKKRTTKRKNLLNKYTALAPKTMRATKKMGNALIQKINYFLNRAVNTVKKTTKIIDKKSSKSIRTFTKKYSRK